VREHGIYSAIPWSPAEQRARFMLDVPRPRTIWERLTEAKRPSLIVDPYLAFAPRMMAGVYLSGLEFVDRMVMQRLSMPHDQHRILQRRFGAPPHLDDVYGAKQGDYLVKWRDHLIAAPGRAADQVFDLLSKNSFDVLWINFAVSHKAGHHLWDPAAVVDEPLDPKTEQNIRGGLPRVYQSIDAAMGRIIHALPEGASIIAFSPTGMGTNTSRGDFLPDMLHRVLGGSIRRPSVRSRSSLWSIRSKIPASWRSAVARALPDRLVADLTTRAYARADWSRTRAIAVPGENKGYIRLNLRGREAHGIVEVSQADQLTDTIIEGLLSFRDPDGSASISKVERMKDLSGGKPYADRLPDLVVFWGDRSANGLTHVSSPQCGEIPRRGVGSGRSGNHTDDAWAVVVPGRSRPARLDRPVWITDIGATACHLLGADMSGLSGKTLLEVA
jgi:predicted AlkP superfamily phosphohydrolase/phosphomutase